MSTFKQRIFRVEGGTLNETMHKMAADQQLALDALNAVADQMGADQVQTWQWSGRFAGFVFKDESKVDQSLLRKQKGCWQPRKTCERGRRLQAKINAIPPVVNLQKALELYGLKVHTPNAFHEGVGHHCHIEGFFVPGIWYVLVPMQVHTPAEMDLYASINNHTGIENQDMEFELNFKPPVDWVEIEEELFHQEWTDLEARYP